MIYANLPDGSYNGHTVEVTVLSKRGVWFKCKFPDGTVKQIHREYMTTDLKDLGILENMEDKNIPTMECPKCKKQTPLWVVHELTCDFCGEYIGCND